MLGVLFVGGAVAVAGAISALLLLAVRGSSRRWVYAVAALSGVGAVLFVANLAMAYAGMRDDDHGVPRGDFAATTMLGGMIAGALMGGLFFGIAALAALRARDAR